MNKMRGALWVAVVVIIVAMVAIVADARPVRVAVSGMGTANDQDQGASRQYAKENAEAQLFCAGSLENVRSIVTGCVNLGDRDAPNYMCTASATGQCVIGQ